MKLLLLIYLYYVSKIFVTVELVNKSFNNLGFNSNSIVTLIIPYEVHNLNLRSGFYYKKYNVSNDYAS